MFLNITIPTKYLSLNVNSVNKQTVTCDKVYIYQSKFGANAVQGHQDGGERNERGRPCYFRDV
jgi:hypothetical protein